MEAVAKFGTGATDSFVTPVALFALIVTVILILMLQRKNVIIAVLCFMILIPLNLQFYIGGVHLFFHRIIILVGLIRVMWGKGNTRGQRLAGGWNSIDTAFSLYVLIQATAFSLQYLQFNAIINQVGFVWDVLGGYLLMRLLIGDHEDVERAVKCTGSIFALVAAGMLIEQMYVINFFGHIGGQLVPEIRDGSVRSLGPFRHTLTAGTAGATAIPLFLYLWYRNNSRAIALLGMMAATIMTITAHASGPLLAYTGSILALLAWPLRKRMRFVRRTVVVSLLILHLVMKAPIWFLVARIDLTGSSSGYHRANLIDQFIGRFSEWWLIGTPNHHNWGYDLWDVQNLYVSIGVEGGLGALVCFITIIVYGFTMLGNARKSIDDEKQTRCLWALGAALFSYMIAFLGVNLFDQSRILWFMLLAMIAAASKTYIAVQKTIYPKAV